MATTQVRDSKEFTFISHVNSMHKSFIPYLLPKFSPLAISICVVRATWSFAGLYLNLIFHPLSLSKAAPKWQRAAQFLTLIFHSTTFGLVDTLFSFLPLSRSSFRLSLLGPLPHGGTNVCRVSCATPGPRLIPIPLRS